MARAIRELPSRTALTLREVVCELPSTIARLVFLSALRNPNSGTYDHALAAKDERAETDRLLRQMHEETFATWLNYRLEEQKADLELYLSGLDCGKATVAQTWLELETFRSFMPASASLADRALFVADVEVRLRTIALGGACSSAGQSGPDTADAPLLTTKQVSTWLGISSRTLRLWAESGEIPAVKIGAQWRFSRREIRHVVKRANR